jgi:hypothetical protein
MNVKTDHTNNTQNNTINLGRVLDVPRLCELYPFIRLTAEGKARRNLSLVTLLSLLYDMDVSCHRPFLLGTSLEPAAIPTAQASSFTLLHTAVLSVLRVMFQV